MAFNHPVEADRVDDLGFFSVFVRAPVEGTLLWILGGHEAICQEEDLSKGSSTNNTKIAREGVISPGGLNRHGERRRKTIKDSLRSKPYMIGSDLSEIGELMDADSSALDEYSDRRSELRKEEQIPRNKKTMSWSDESGQDLVSYLGETKPCDSPHRPSNAAKPTKSVLKRSRSVRRNAGSTETSVDVSRCIPKGLDGGHGGLLIPTKPYGMDCNSRFSDQAANTAPSPEWGWYINTTPPTPEMYHSREPKPVSSKPTLSSRPTTLTNPAFSKASNKHGAMGWANIPL